MIVHVAKSNVLRWLHEPGTLRFYNSTQEFAQKHGVEACLGSTDSVKQPPMERLAHVSATVLISGRALEDAEILFYYIAPFTVHERQTAQDDLTPQDVEPVVSISLPLGYLLGLMKELYSVNSSSVTQELEEALK